MKTVKIKGMSCQHCVKIVKKSLEEIEGIDNVAVDLASGEASFEETRPVDEDLIREKIKKAGYDVFLVLEATIGFNRRDEGEDEAEAEPAELAEEQPKRFEATGKIKFTTQDHRFLRALKIAVDDETR